MQFPRHAVFAALLGLGMLACGPGGPRFTQAPQVQPNPNPRVPQAAVLTFAADAPVSTTVRLSDGTHDWELAFGPERDPAEGLPLIGMRPDREHAIEVAISNEAGETKAAPLAFTTPPLPDNREEFPPIEVTVNKAGELEPGFVFFNPRRARPGVPRFGASFGMLLAADYNGDVLWYYRMDSRISDFEILGNGNIAYVTQDFRVTEIDWLGNTAREWYAAGRPQGPQEGAIAVEGTLTFHHEIDELPNGNLVVLGSEIREIPDYYTSETNARAPRKTQKVMGDIILEFVPDTGEVVWDWKAFDHVDPYRLGYETFDGYWVRRGFPGVIDWSHANNLLYDDSDDSLIINFRYQAAALKIDRKSNQIKWVFGEPGGWGDLSNKTLKPDGDVRWPYHHHSPTPTPNGTLLVFDNGNYQARPFDKPKPPSETWTRVVEYAIDEEKRTVRELWQSEALGPDSVVSIAMGDVEWLPETQNILAAYGFAMAREDVDGGKFNWGGAINFQPWTLLRQFKRSDPPEVVWEMVLDDRGQNPPVGWTLFGAEHFPDWSVINGE